MSDMVEWVDMGLEKFARGFASLEKTSVQVGVVGEEGERTASSGRITIAEAALIDEFGSRKARIPARKAISRTITAAQAKRAGKQVASALVEGGNTDAALTDAGTHFVRLIQQKILDGDFRPNADSTVAKKGFDHPLIDTGEFLAAISYKIVQWVGAGGSDHDASEFSEGD